MKIISMKTVFAIGVSATVLLCVSFQATASPVVPDAFWQAVLHNGSTTGGQSQTTVGGSTSLSSGALSATATGTLQPTLLPSISGTASVTNGSGNASASVFAEIFFSVSGPTGFQVPIIVTANGAITQSLITPNNAQLFLGTPSAVALIASACLPAHGNLCTGLSNQSSFSIANTFLVTSDQQDNLQLSLFVNANTLFIPGGGTDTQSGFIDPMITIDPTYEFADLFSIVTSSNVGNSSAATPLPAALPLFASGLGTLGLLGWRRKKKTAALLRK